MKNQFSIRLISGSLAVLVVCASYGTEQRYSPQELEAAKAKLREHNRLWTFEAGAILAREWLNRAPEDAELRGLYARQLHGQIYGPEEIQEQTDSILERDPDNPWGLYAQALAFLADWKRSEAAVPSLRAWKLLPHPEFAATHLQALSYKSTEEGMAFLDSVDAETLQHPEVLHARAELADAVRGLARYERRDLYLTYSIAPISMADHTPYAEEAAEIARSGIHD